MNSSLKSTILHGLEVLGALILAFVIDFFLQQIAPQLPQTQTLVIATTLLTALAKWIRSNPNIPVPDYVNEPVGRARK